MQTEIDTLKKENAELRDLNGRLEWRFGHAKSQYLKLLDFVIPLMDETKRKEIFQDLGRNCARSLGWVKRYIGDPEGFFKHMMDHSGEHISFSEDRRTITVVTKERPCDCPLAKGACLRGAYCDCSIGWQMETYETILRTPVKVAIKEAVFRGSDRCVFEITIEE